MQTRMKHFYIPTETRYKTTYKISLEDNTAYEKNCTNPAGTVIRPVGSQEKENREKGRNPGPSYTGLA